MKKQVQGIMLNWIVVADIEAAIKFFTDVVGLTLQEFHKEFGWAELSGPTGSRLGLAQESPACDKRAGTNAVVTITVDDIVVACKEFQKKGVRLIGEIMEVPGEVKLQTFLDSDGNMMQLAQLLK